MAAMHKATNSQTAVTIWDDDDDDASAGVVSSDRYVPALRPAAPVAPRPAAPSMVDIYAAPALHTSSAIDSSDELIRARGFVWRVAPLATAFGVSAAVLAIVAGAGGAWPIVILFVVFAATWLLALIWHVNRSPAGIAWMQARSLWRMAERQQRYNLRVDWYERTRRHDK
jgi:hypothetical protein